MEQLKAKLKKQGGFTMVELLIVVAIIAVLVAVSIPMMNSALERSRHAVDQANVRDALALAMVEYITNADDPKFTATGGATYTYYVDNNSQGKLLETTGGTTPTVPNGFAPVEPSCECDTASTLSALTVTVTVTNGEPAFVTNWHYNGTSTVSGDANTP